MKRWLVVMLVLLLAGCRQQDLLISLNQQQANEVLAVLQRHNITAEKKEHGKNGYTITISQEDFPAAVDLLKTYHLPARADVEVSDLFPTDALVSSPRAEKARLFSAIEQRLEQSLRQMEGISSARIHVSYDIEAGENGKPASPVHLSALVVFTPDRSPDKLVNDIKRFLINTFVDVKYENISVVLSRQSEIQQQSPTTSGQGLLVGSTKLVTVLVVGVLGVIFILYLFLLKSEKYVSRLYQLIRRKG